MGHDCKYIYLVSSLNGAVMQFLRQKVAEESELLSQWVESVALILLPSGSLLRCSILMWHGQNNRGKMSPHKILTFYSLWLSNFNCRVFSCFASLWEKCPQGICTQTQEGMDFVHLCWLPSFLVGISQSLCYLLQNSNILLCTSPKVNEPFWVLPEIHRVSLFLWKEKNKNKSFT